MSDIKSFSFGDDRRSALGFAFEFWFNVENVKIENNNWTVFLSKPANLEAEKPAAPIELEKVEPKKNEPKPKRKRDYAAEKLAKNQKRDANNKKDSAKAVAQEPKVEQIPEDEDRSEPESVEEMTAPNDFTEPPKVHHIRPIQPKKTTIKGLPGLALLKNRPRVN